MAYGSRSRRANTRWSSRPSFHHSTRFARFNRGSSSLAREQDIARWGRACSVADENDFRIWQPRRFGQGAAQVGSVVSKRAWPTSAWLALYTSPFDAVSCDAPVRRHVQHRPDGRRWDRPDRYSHQYMSHVAGPTSPRLYTSRAISPAASQTTMRGLRCANRDRRRCGGPASGTPDGLAASRDEDRAAVPGRGEPSSRRAPSTGYDT